MPSPAQFLSANPHFCISALSRYTQQDFIALVERHGIAWHEKTLGQLFCDGSAAQIIDMLLAEMKEAGAQLRLNAKVQYVEKTADGFTVQLASRRSAGMRRAGGGDRRQVHSQDGRDRFRLSPGRAVRRAA